MQVVIIGAGNVGFTLARTLSKQHSVMMIEQDEKRFEHIVESLDVGALNANGASPKVLRNAINGKTEMLLAVTERDEVNIFACLVAKQLKPNLCTVARVRNPDYLEGGLDSDLLNVDYVLSPEHLTAAKMKMIATIENAVDYECIPALGVEMAKFRVTAKHLSVLSKPIEHLPVPENSRIIVVHRRGEVIMPKGNDFLVVGDEVTVIGTGDGIERFNDMLGRVREPRDFIIVGGGIVGEHLLGMLEGEGYSIKLVEKDEARCRALSRQFNNTVIINDKGADPSVLRNENVNMADVLICATDSEEENLLACLIGKHLGVPKTVTKYSRREYENVFDMSGVDAAIGYYHVVANEIVKRTVPELNVLLLLEGFTEEFFGVVITDQCRQNGKMVDQIELPERSIIAMVVKEGKATIPTAETVLGEGDMVLIYASRPDISRLERMFRTHIPLNP